MTPKEWRQVKGIQRNISPLCVQAKNLSHSPKTQKGNKKLNHNRRQRHFRKPKSVCRIRIEGELRGSREATEERT